MCLERHQACGALLQNLLALACGKESLTWRELPDSAPLSTSGLCCTTVCPVPLTVDTLFEPCQGGWHEWVWESSF